MLERRDERPNQRLFDLAFGKRPAEELYDLKADSYEMDNCAADWRYAKDKAHLRVELDRWMKNTADPRAGSDADPWDAYPYYGGAAGKKK